MIIRKAKLKEANEIVKLWKGFMKSHYDAVKSKKPLKTDYALKKTALCNAKKHIIHNIRSRNSLFLVAEDNSNLIGYSLVVIKKNIPIFKLSKLGYLSDFFVKKDYRGKGISSKFHKEIIKWLKSKKINRLELAVDPINKKAYQVYKKWGFIDWHIKMRKRI